MNKSTLEDKRNWIGLGMCTVILSLATLTCVGQYLRGVGNGFVTGTQLLLLILAIGTMVFYRKIKSTKWIKGLLLVSTISSYGSSMLFSTNVMLYSSIIPGFIMLLVFFDRKLIIASLVATTPLLGIFIYRMSALGNLSDSSTLITIAYELGTVAIGIVLIGWINELTMKEIREQAKAREKENLDKIKAMELVLETSQVIATNVSEVIDKTSSIKNSLEDVNSSINEIAQGAAEQAEAAKGGVENIAALNQILDVNQANINQLKQTNQALQDVRSQSQVILNEVTDRTNQDLNDTQEIYGKIVDTQESIKKIEGISDRISQITQQTNLLALNASIEAARSGESGKGFAVVAQEIKKLADETKSFTGNIVSLVKELIENGNDMIYMINALRGSMSGNVEIVTNMNDKFEGIQEVSNELGKVVDELGNTVQKIDISKVQLTNVMQGVSNIAEVNATSTEEILSSMEEQLEYVNKVVDSGKELARLKDNLENEIKSINGIEE